MHAMDCSCAPILQFFYAASDGATVERKIQNRNFWSISYQFEEGQRCQLRMDLDTVFAICQKSRCALQCTKDFVVPSLGGATRFANLRQKFLENVKKSAAELCQILRMVGYC